MKKLGESGHWTAKGTKSTVPQCSYSIQSFSIATSFGCIKRGGELDTLFCC